MEEKCRDSINSNTLDLTTSSAVIVVSTGPHASAELLGQPSTSHSHSSSMSLLQEDFANSRHDFAEVLDDETTTSGVLETFEISSSNSLPTCSDARAGVAVDDSSSTDTIKLVEVSDATSCNNGFYNDSEVYVINDDDEEEDEDEELGNEEEEEEEEERGCAGDGVVPSKRLQMTEAGASHLANQMSSVIVTNGGATIYLETPVIEEQQHHPQLISLAGGQVEYVEKTGKPKRLSDEFMLTDEAEPLMQIGDGTLSINNSSNSVNGANETSARVHISEAAPVVSDGGECNAAELLPDRVSFRLKKMNINNTASTQHIVTPFAEPTNDLPSSSSNSSTSVTTAEQDLMAPSMAYIESMDLIERRDFETEQRLTGGIVLKSSTLMNKNMLNLSLIKSCVQQAEQADIGADCPSSSSNSTSNINAGNIGRAVSSDSKCAYKDPSATPTSSRNYNSRLTKSTAKLNLCSTLSHPQQEQQQQLDEQQESLQLARASIAKIQLKLQKPGPSSASTSLSTCSSASSSSSTSSSSSLSSSVIVEAPSTSASATPVCTGGSGSMEIFSNSNSNDSLMGGTGGSGGGGEVSGGAGLGGIGSTVTSTITNCHQEEKMQSQQQQHLAAADKPEESGCSRTSFIHAAVTEAESNTTAYDDAQPSTSSARCQYAPPPKSLRQVHASAQTTERYLPRGASSVPLSAGGTVAVSSSGINYRLRRRSDLVSQLVAASAGRTAFNDDPSWADCEENNSDVEEICTCHHSSSGSDSSHGGSNTSLNETDDADLSCVTGKDGDLSNYIQMVSISEEISANGSDCATASSLGGSGPQRKRKYNEGRLVESDAGTAVSSSGNGMDDVAASRKRIAYDCASTPRSSLLAVSSALVLTSTPTSQLAIAGSSSSPIGRRTPRSLIPTRDNPPPELQSWLSQFNHWSHAERLLAIDRLIEHCEPTQVRHMMKVIEPQFQRDFISLLPRELALQVLAYLEPKDLLRAGQTCRSWRFLCDDNLLWKEKCRKAHILAEPRSDRPKRGRAGNMPPIASPWKAAYMRQHTIEMNWRSRPIREPKVLKGHDDHVITCLQFSGNRIVSGSDDNTLKVWSAVSGRCLRTLVGHTGGVWSSQMSGSIIISGSTDRTLKVWDIDTGQCLHTLLGHTSTVRCMHLHGNKVVSGSRDATLRVWDIEQGTCLHVLVGHLAAVRCVQYDGKLIVSGAYDYMVKIWHPERQECLHTLSGHTNRVYSLQFDGTHVVSGSLDTSIRVWDVETGNIKHTLMGHQSLTSGMELRQNILVSGNADSTVKVWDITTGQCLQTLSGPNKHQSAVTCLQFNSRFVVTSSDDGTVKLWDVKTGEFIRNLVALDSGGSGGVVWRIRANDTKLICAVGSRNGTEETKLMVLDFDVEGACVKCS